MRKIKNERVRFPMSRTNWDGFNDLNPPSTQQSMVTLLHVPPRSFRRRPARLELTVTLNETKTRGANTMRVVFQTELKVDIDTTDDSLRKAFIDLILLKAREVYGVAGMLAKGTPVMQVFVIDRDGKQPIPLFAGAVRDEDDEDSGE